MDIASEPRHDPRPGLPRRCRPAALVAPSPQPLTTNTILSIGMILHCSGTSRTDTSHLQEQQCGDLDTTASTTTNKKWNKKASFKTKAT